MSVDQRREGKPASEDAGRDRRTPPPKRRGTAVANSFYSLISQFSSGIFTAIITLYLTRELGSREFGVFAIAVGVSGLVAPPADLGISSSTARYVADHRDEPRRVAAILADALRLKLITSMVVSAGLFALAGPIAHAYHAPLLWPLRLTAFVVFGMNLMSLFEASFIAVGEIGSWVRVAMGESATECVTSIALVALGTGVVGASAGRAIGYMTGGLIALAIGARRFRWPGRMRRRGRPRETTAIARYAAPLLLVTAANSLFSAIDVLIIGAYLGSQPAGLFSAPMRLLVVLWYPGNAVANGVAPRLSRGGERDDGTALAGGLRVLITLYALMLAPIVIWSAPIIRILLGPQYTGSVTTMRWLAAATMLGGLAPLVSVSANFLGDVRSRVWLMIAAVVIDGVFDVIFVPRIGIVSGAIATAIAYALMFLGHLRICGRHVQIPYGRLALTTFRCIFAAGVMAVFCTLWGSNPGIPSFALGLVLGTVVFLAVLLAIGEVNGTEARRALGTVRSRFSRPRRG